ncbi:MAG TPA: hypothetical protein VFB79_01775, partial [Candidatus Angelobacter sp.]|nr:hypothetical protein [Candidatus Angelobacter sp.]
ASTAAKHNTGKHCYSGRNYNHATFIINASAAGFYAAPAIALSSTKSIATAKNAAIHLAAFSF